MKNIHSFDKNNLEDVRSKLESKLAELKEFGLHIDIGSISYNTTSFSAKLRCQLVQNGEDAKPEHVLNWEKGFHFKHGFEKEDLGKTISFRGEKYEIVGCSTRASKNGIRIADSNGKVYKFDSNEAVRLLKS